MVVTPVEGHFHPIVLFDPPPQLMVPQQLFFYPKPSSSRSLFLLRNHGKNIRLIKKRFSPVNIHSAVKSQVHWQGFLMSCRGLLKAALLGNCMKRKIKKKIREILRKTLVNPRVPFLPYQKFHSHF